MLFNSIPFLILFIFTYSIYWLVNGVWKRYVLLISSILFYSYSSIALTAHFLLVVLINFYFAKKLLESGDNDKSSKFWIRISVILNLLNLSIFKYFYFITGSIYTITGLSSIKEFSLSIQIALPLAISFYTFQIIAYLVDIYRKKITKKVSVLDFLIFILFFPQLIAGPIMRSEEFLPSLDSPMIDWARMEKGIYLILTGLLKKVVIADSIGGIINIVYPNVKEYSMLSLALTSFGFISQVYCDFSGYTDMARGLANLLGFELPTNFRGPYISKSFTEFWTRWHVTLSTWLRDYIYISLGGNRAGELRANTNMLITMTLGGLWHGANITYLIWGFYLGLILFIERAFPKKEIVGVLQKILYPFQVFIVFSLFAISGIFFRSGMLGDKSLETSFQFLKGIFSLQSGKLIYRHEELISYIFLTLIFNYIEFRGGIFQEKRILRFVFLPFYAMILLLLLGLFGDGGADFIYFQF
ncbi:MAG: MBOAT family O-acyltransferase [Leptospiraceae bacterium]|nr:MBOAT family O-acyltransferase [Leptospiraceae bacterium]